MTEERQHETTRSDKSPKRDGLSGVESSSAEGRPTIAGPSGATESSAAKGKSTGNDERGSPVASDPSSPPPTVGPSTETDRTQHAPPNTSAENPPQAFLDNRVIGWTFLAFVSILGLSMVFAFVYFVIVSLASPSFLDDYVRTRPDVPAQLTVTLEYESWTMRTMGVQIAFGFLVGLVFAGIGVLLFAAGANGALRLKSSADWLPLSISASAPGLAVLTLGGIIIAMAVSKDVRRDMTAEMNLPGQGSGKQGTKQVTSTPPHDPGGEPRQEPE